MYRYINDKHSRDAERQGRGHNGQFHEIVARARYNGVPKLLAWVAAACVAVCMVLWGYVVNNNPQIVLVIVLFFIYRIVFGAIAGLVFLILDVSTRRSYTNTADRFRDNSFDQSDSHSSYDYAEYRVQDEEYEAARRLFNLTEPFTMEDLKRARNELIKILHPDEGGSAAQFREVMRAYELLTNHLNSCEK